MIPYIYAYNGGSQSAKLLGKELGAKRIKLVNSRYKEGPNKVVINWGSTKCPYASLNDAAKVKVACNKLSFFKMMDFRGCSGLVPMFYTDLDGLDENLFKALKRKIFCRTKLTGNSGEGIVVASKFEELVEAPLYTLEFLKTHEYRIHVGKTSKGEYTIIQEQYKGKRKDVEADGVIRNHDNGYVFVINNIVVPDVVREVAIKCFKLTGLDFGALDIGYNKRTDKAVVFEVNTAPGIEGTTLNKYVEFFKERLGDNR